jgi:hypothetical protein
MSFELSDVIDIISTIDNFLSMSEHKCVIDTSTGYGYEDDEDDEDDDEDNNDAVFIQFKFPLKNGISEVRIYNSIGFFIYKYKNGESLKEIEFDDNDIAATNSSFKKALKQIRDFDRQHHVNTASSTHAPTIDRASFGLAEVS